MNIDSNAKTLDPPAGGVDVQAFINTHPFSPFQRLVFVLCFVIVLLDGFDTAAIGYVGPSLLAEWNLDRSHLAAVLSAALFGLVFGALVAGPWADRWGRKGLLVSSTALFGLACAGSGFARNLEELTILRFVTGLGLGAAMPSAVTLMSEFCPENRRSTITNLMFCGFPLGAAFGGFLAAWMIPHLGWRSVLWFGGGVPLVLFFFLLRYLPESVRYLAASQYPVKKTLAILQKISSDIPSPVSANKNNAETETKETKGVLVVVSSSYLFGTLMLWLAYFMGLVIFYALINWMPILFKEAGLSPQRATLISALFPLGGVGAVFFGFLMDRFNSTKVVAIGFALTAAAVWSIGLAVNTSSVLIACVFLAGVLMNTSQSSLPALAASFYPTSGRATGVSWMLGVGRFGGLAGSFLVGELSRKGFTFSEVFAFVAVAGLISSMALFAKLGLRRSGLSGQVQA